MLMFRKVNLIALLLMIVLLLTSCSLPSWPGSQPDQSQTSQASQPTVTSPEDQDTQEPDPATPTAQSENVQMVERTVLDESDDPRYEIQIAWPNLQGPEGMVGGFNQEIDGIVQSLQEQFLNDLRDRQAESEMEAQPPASTLTMTYEVTYFDQKFVSVYLLIDQYIAISAHPFSFSKTFNYDLQQGEFVPLSNLFMPEVDPVGVIVEAIEPALEGKGFGYQAGTAADVMGTRENWNIFTEGLRVNFDVYEVAPYAAGPQYFIIPWEDIVGRLDLEGPAGNFVD